MTMWAMLLLIAVFALAVSIDQLNLAYALPNGLMKTIRFLYATSSFLMAISFAVNAYEVRKTNPQLEFENLTTLVKPQQK